MDISLQQLRNGPEVRAQVLRGAGFFRDNMESDLIDELALRVLAEVYAPGRDLCQMGEVADSVIVVVSGRVVIPGSGEDGPSFGPGDVIGDFGLLVGSGDATRTESLVAAEETVVLEIPYEHLLVHRSSLLFAIGRRVHAALTAANQRIRRLTQL